MTDAFELALMKQVQSTHDLLMRCLGFGYQENMVCKQKNIDIHLTASYKSEYDLILLIKQET